MAKDDTGRLHVTVKTGGKRKLSSKLWLERQLNDPYVAQAKRDGCRSRAAYKLKEIDDKYKLLKSGMAVIDLGAAPGGWSQTAARKVGSGEERGKVVAIDLLEMPELPGVTCAQLDFLDPSAPDKLGQVLGGGADFVMSDMAPNTTGHRTTDRVAHPGAGGGRGRLRRRSPQSRRIVLAKVFQSGADAALLAELKRDFTDHPPCEAGGEPPGFIGALSARDRVSPAGLTPVDGTIFRKAVMVDLGLPQAESLSKRSALPL